MWLGPNASDDAELAHRIALIRHLLDSDGFKTYECVMQMLNELRERRYEIVTGMRKNPELLRFSLDVLDEHIGKLERLEAIMAPEEDSVDEKEARSQERLQ
jgi:hypothetical protein